MQFHFTWGLVRKQKMDYVVWVDPVRSPAIRREPRLCDCKMVFHVDVTSLPPELPPPPPGYTSSVCDCNGHLIE